MIETPRIVRAEPRLTAVIRLTVPRADIQKVMGPGIAEVLAVVAAQRIGPAGPVVAHHLKMDPGTFDFEIGVPVRAPVSPVGRVQPSELPAVTVARTIYHGSYEGLPSAWAELMGWIAAEGHTPAPDLWECYLTGPETSPDSTTWRTELNRPLVAVSSGARR